MTFVDERLMAEQAIESKDGQQSPYPPAAKRVHDALQRAGMAASDLGPRCGVGRSEYQDVDAYDSELFSCVNVGHLPIISGLLGMPLLTLLFGGEPDRAPAAISYADFVAQIQAEAARRGVGLSELGDGVGWELEGLVAEPDGVGRLNLVALYDICAAMGMDWIGVLVWAEKNGRRTTR